MTDTTDVPYDALERIFHEPNRLAIMCALAGEGKGLTFTDLKATCNLTDGNLNRHLKVLREAGAVSVSKKFVKEKPRTTIRLTPTGLKQFSEYLSALESVLDSARQSVSATVKTAKATLNGRIARA